MSLVPYLLAYAGIAVFVIAVVARIRMYSSMPMHLRWELYPVPHEASRAAHGGSYLEEVDWWLKPREVSKVAEAKAMATEIGFLEALHKHNRPLWRSSFPFHFGLYLSIAATVLMLAGGVLSRFAGGLMASGVGSVWRAGIVFTGALGSALVLFGALGLLRKRLWDPDLADYTTPGDVFNLAFFVVAFGCAFATFVVFDRDFALASQLVANLVTFNLQPVASGTAGIMLGLSVGLLAALVGYIPLTHMSHFVGKYFAYHSVRWGDEPNLKGGPQEQAIVANLMQKVTWAGPHIQSQGQKNWVEIATMDYPQYGGEKKS
jgi:nitrate reductase gamma subunit